MTFTRPPSTLEPMAVESLLLAMKDSNRRTVDLINGLDERDLIGPRKRILSPPLWVLGHVAWLYDNYLLQRSNSRPSNIPEMGEFFDDRQVRHPDLWGLDFPTRGFLLNFFERVTDAVPAALGRGPLASPESTFLCRMCIQREDMWGETLITQLQTLGLSPPKIIGNYKSQPTPLTTADINIPGGVHSLGAVPEDSFYLDNEKWGHGYEVEPFSISPAAVTNGEFIAFVEDKGYDREELWSKAGWSWRCHFQASMPIYWRLTADGWQQKRFDQWRPLNIYEPICHVNWFEADAWCRWAGRRLPWEGEWEIAASLSPHSRERICGPKKRYPWGDDLHEEPIANLDCIGAGPCAVSAFSAGDSAYGLRQMMGNVWEWTQSVLSDYPGFTPDAMEHWSKPFMDGAHPVLRGGSWVTRSRSVWNTFRHFCFLDRRDLFTGFRTCAL